MYNQVLLKLITVVSSSNTVMKAFSNRFVVCGGGWFCVCVCCCCCTRSTAVREYYGTFFAVCPEKKGSSTKSIKFETTDVKTLENYG